MGRYLADTFVGVSISGAAYEVFALATKRTPPITSLARRWRAERNPLILLIIVPWLGLGWHLLVQK